ncbi:MAG TPA: hypothetical protein VN843_25570 [Anaerolineales bacterium]|nr:hypothetical protein [Anaerolineales bacterium]
MSESSSRPLTFSERHPILRQAVDDAIHLSWQQMGVPLLGASAGPIITLVNEYNAGRLHGWPDAKTLVYFLVWSLVVGVTLYAIVAVVRAPFVVIGRQQRELADLKERLGLLEAMPLPGALPPLPSVRAFLVRIKRFGLRMSLI